MSFYFQLVERWHPVPRLMFGDIQEHAKIDLPDFPHVRSPANGQKRTIHHVDHFRHISGIRVLHVRFQHAVCRGLDTALVPSYDCTLTKISISPGTSCFFICIPLSWPSSGDTWLVQGPVKKRIVTGVARRREPRHCFGHQPLLCTYYRNTYQTPTWCL